MPAEIRKVPCEACPYRQDVPSGVWAHEEYEKLRRYDAETASQPFVGFACHATPKKFCHGWAVVHTSRGNEHDLIALRLAGVQEIPEPKVPLFGSGNEAADHGQAEIEDPTEEAMHVADRLTRKHERIRRAQENSR